MVRYLKKKATSKIQTDINTVIWFVGQQQTTAKIEHISNNYKSIVNAVDVVS